jgi:hypothetical protein
MAAKLQRDDRKIGYMGRVACLKKETIDKFSLCQRLITGDYCKKNSQRDTKFFF